MLRNIVDRRFSISFSNLNFRGFKSSFKWGFSLKHACLLRQFVSIYPFIHLSIFLFIRLDLCKVEQKHSANVWLVEKASIPHANSKDLCCFVTEVRRIRGTILYVFSSTPNVKLGNLHGDWLALQSPTLPERLVLLAKSHVAKTHAHHFLSFRLLTESQRHADFSHDLHFTPSLFLPPLPHTVQPCLLLFVEQVQRDWRVLLGVYIKTLLAQYQSTWLGRSHCTSVEFAPAHQSEWSWSPQSSFCFASNMPLLCYRLLVKLHCRTRKGVLDCPRQTTHNSFHASLHQKSWYFCTVLIPIEDQIAHRKDSQISLQRSHLSTKPCSRAIQRQRDPSTVSLLLRCLATRGSINKEIFWCRPLQMNFFGFLMIISQT